MLPDYFQPFIKESSVSVMVRGLLERFLNPAQLDEWFKQTAQDQYTRKLLFSSVLGLMTEVVCGVKPSLNRAYSAHRDELPVSLTSVYNKVNGIETQTSAALVRYSAEQAQPVIEGLGATGEPVLAGYPVRILDGNCLAASEKRLKPLRGERAAALPGKSVVVYDPALGLILTTYPCENGHAQERSVLNAVLAQVQAGEVWIGDRNFCTRGFLHGIDQREAFFIIREHEGLPWEPLEGVHACGRIDTGSVCEQRIEVVDENGKRHTWRRICVELEEPTRNGDQEVYILTNLPADEVDACQIANAYRNRWRIETAFQHLEQNFNSEINTLGYPRAALFGFSVALVAYNVFAVVMATLRSAHPDNDIDATVSSYALAEELGSTYRGMMIALPAPEWQCFQALSVSVLVALLHDLAGSIRLSAFSKKRRGPKKPVVKKPYNRKRPHVSTQKLLAAAAAAKNSSP